MIRTVQLLIMQLIILAGELTETAPRRFAELRAERERGGGRGSMEEVLLALGGLLAAGVVVGVIAAVVASRSDQIK